MVFIATGGALAPANRTNTGVASATKWIAEACVILKDAGTGRGDHTGTASIAALGENMRIAPTRAAVVAKACWAA